MTNEEIMEVVKPAICAKLKSPASAQFPKELITITGNDEQGYEVKGMVDSQNSYGAMIRNDFSASVSLTNIGGKPFVSKATVGVKAAANNAVQFGVNYIAITIFTIIGGALLSLIIGMLVSM